MRNSFIYFYCCLIISLSFSTCQSDSKNEAEQTDIPKAIEDTLYIATGSEMGYVAQVLAQTFTLDHPTPYKVQIIGGEDLFQQIQKDTRFDFIFSTDQALLDQLYKAGLSPDAPFDLAYGKLVLWTTQTGFMPDLVALRSPTINLVAVPDPKTTAYGLVALSILEKEQLMDFLGSRLVYQDDLSQTNQLINSGEVSIGFTSKSMLLSPQYTEVGSWIEVDDRLYDPVPHQFMRLHKTDVDHPLAATFEQFVKSQRVKDILANFGYLPNGLLGNN
ncbi:MAG: molybdate ABC transporter substrate-binding protein [Bacteroidota bacterium]